MLHLQLTFFLVLNHERPNPTVSAQHGHSVRWIHYEHHTEANRTMEKMQLGCLETSKGSGCVGFITVLWYFTLHRPASLRFITTCSSWPHEYSTVPEHSETCSPWAYIWHFIKGNLQIAVVFTFSHLADALIQSVQSVFPVVSPGLWPVCALFEIPKVNSTMSKTSKWMDEIMCNVILCWRNEWAFMNEAGCERNFQCGFDRQKE